MKREASHNVQLTNENVHITPTNKGFLTDSIPTLGIIHSRIHALNTEHRCVCQDNVHEQRA